MSDIESELPVSFGREGNTEMISQVRTPPFNDLEKKRDAIRKKVHTHTASMISMKIVVGVLCVFVTTLP